MRPALGRSEWPLVHFTVLTQAAAGIAVMSRSHQETSLVLLAGGGLIALGHLERPVGARFALANLRSSRLSRELLLVGLFGTTTLAALFVPAMAPVAAVAGIVLVLGIAHVYLIRTVPAWNRWTTPAAFLLTALLLGSADATHPLAVTVCAGLQALVGCFATPGRRRALLGLRTILLASGAALFWWRSGITNAAGLLLLVGAEVLGRYLFYASHRRVGL